MPLPDLLDIEHYRGDTLIIVVNVFDDLEKTQPSDLSQAIVSAEVRASADSTDVAAVIETNIVDNSVTCHLSADDCATLGKKNRYDVEVDFYGDRTYVRTVLAGALKITADVTRPYADEAPILDIAPAKTFVDVHPRVVTA